MPNLNQIKDSISHLRASGKPRGWLDRTLWVYRERGECDTVFEAPECLYRAGYEVEGITADEAEWMSYAYQQYGNAMRDNTVEQAIALGQEIKRETP